MSNPSAQDEARRALADRLESSIKAWSHDIWFRPMVDSTEWQLILAALRAPSQDRAADARHALEGLDPRFSYEQHASFFRTIAEHWNGDNREAYIAKARAIEDAIRALPLPPDRKGTEE